MTFATPPGPIAGALTVALPLHTLSIVVRERAEAGVTIFAEVALLAHAYASISVANAVAVALEAAAGVLNS